MAKPLLAAAVLCAVAVMALHVHACVAQRRPNLDCVCPAVYRPVCGSDGRTYSNGCEANCNGRSVRKRMSGGFFTGGHSRYDVHGGGEGGLRSTVKFA